MALLLKRLASDFMADSVYGPLPEKQYFLAVHGTLEMPGDTAEV